MNPSIPDRVGISLIRLYWIENLIDYTQSKEKTNYIRIRL